MKILLPVDLLHPIEPVIDLLNSLCNLKQGDVKLLYVRELLPAYENVIKTSGSFIDDWEQRLDNKARERLSEFLVKLKTTCRSVSTEVTSGSVAATIAEVAEDEEFDLIVVTPGLHPGPERILAGSVAARVLDKAHCPVLVGRPTSNHTDGLKNVLFGCDGSDNAKFAIEKALSIFKIAESGAKVTVVHSVDVAEPVKLLSPVEFVAAIEQNLLMAGETFLAQAEKVLSDRGVKNMDCCLIEGDPAAGLLRMTRDINADLVITGSRGHGPVADLFLGSVSRKVAMHAGGSVVVMKNALPK
jgi:nucleotide-binding universal stress UspA family protein